METYGPAQRHETCAPGRTADQPAHSGNIHATSRSVPNCKNSGKNTGINACGYAHVKRLFKANSYGGHHGFLYSSCTFGRQWPRSEATAHPAQEGPYTPQESRSRHASHKASNSHRAPNRKKKNTGKGKHRVLKWVLGIFFSLIGLGLLAGIAVFAYLYTTTEVPQPEKFALAEKTTVYYADGTTAIGSYAEQNREIISWTTSATRLWRPKTVRSTRIKALI